MSDVARTLRAVAEVFVPGRDAGDPTEGAPEVEAERFLEHYLDLLLPGLATQVCALLDQGTEAGFASLDLAGREAALDDLAAHDVPEVRSLVDLLATLSVASVYGEWSGQDAEGEMVQVPLGWELSGYGGPVRARPDLLPR